MNPALLWSLAWVVGLGQPTQPTPVAPAPAPTPPAAQPANQQQLPHQVVLARRLARLQGISKTADTVLIVSDSTSYLAAIAAWQAVQRFPVLIDDGTLAAHEDIARFVRAYKPKQVVRWKAKDAPPGFPAQMEPALLEKILATSWGLPPEHASQVLLFEAWKKLEFQPPGIVFMQADDPAWPAALALAAGRGQPIASVHARTGVDGALSLAEADELEKSIEQWAEATKLPWRGLGDAIEAVTLCVNLPAKIDSGKNGEMFATTDRIGRISTGAEPGTRWAWTGQVHGNQQQSCYRAMCSLFLATHRSWVFDGYPTSDPWNYWDGTKTAKFLKEVGVPTEIDDTPRQGSRDWRLRAARAVNAELIFVNSKGNSDFFDLEPGQCRPGDIPILQVPAAVHFVHSWSAQFPGSRETVAGRWFERGVFCYAGSVNEPFLQAFQPTPAAAMRLAAGAPFAAALRVDDPKLWKVAIFGDPLYNVCKDGPRYEAPTFPDGVIVGANLRELLTAGKYVEAIEALTLVGKDAEAAQLATTLLKEKPAEVTPRLAAVAVQACMRRGDNKGVVRLFQKLGPEMSKDLVLRDVLWLAAYPLLDVPDDEVLRVLYDNIRADQAGRDATTLAAAWARRNGRQAADAMLANVRKALPEDQRKAYDEALKQPIEKWGL